MTDRTERAVLNHLIETCKDAERGFRHVAGHATDPVLKGFFLDIASQRAQFAADLLPHAQRLGGSEPHDGTARGTWVRRWRSLRDSIVHHDDQARMAEAEQEEQRVLAMYGGALDEILPPGTRDLVEYQATEIRKDHGTVQARLAH